MIEPGKNAIVEGLQADRLKLAGQVIGLDGLAVLRTGWVGGHDEWSVQIGNNERVIATLHLAEPISDDMEAFLKSLKGDDYLSITLEKVP